MNTAERRILSVIADDADVAIDLIPKPVSPWVARATAGRLPYKVYASLNTDVRTTLPKRGPDSGCPCGWCQRREGPTLTDCYYRLPR